MSIKKSLKNIILKCNHVLVKTKDLHQLFKWAKAYFY